MKDCYFVSILQIVLIVLKLLGVISCSWWIIFLPDIICLSFLAVLLLAVIVSIIVEIKKEDEN